MAYRGQVMDNPVSGERFVFHQTTGDSGGELLALELVLDPHGHVPGGHVHPVQEERFEVVWEFYSIRKRHRIRLKTRAPESDCVVDSLTDIWKGADFMEREVYDMMGIRFRNHPDLRRILMPDDYTEGYPLRKDFPLRGKGWRDTFDFLDEVPR